MNGIITCLLHGEYVLPVCVADGIKTLLLHGESVLPLFITATISLIGKIAIALDLILINGGVKVK